MRDAAAAHEELELDAQSLVVPGGWKGCGIHLWTLDRQGDCPQELQHIR